MGLVGRMWTVMTLVWTVLLVLLVVVAELVGFAFWVAPIVVFLLVFLQWLVGPFILRWIFRIEWVDHRHWGPEMAAFIERVVAEEGIPMPRFGVIHDNNPNAFAFGWTRNRAHIVLTDGMTRYCKEREVRAVMAHEMGHVVNNDFVVMTMMTAVPILLYVTARVALHFASHAKGNRLGLAAGVAGVVALVLWLFSNLVVLLVNRFREHYADAFAARVTQDPNALASALVKVSYGLATEAATTNEADERRVHAKYQNALMLQNPREGTALVVRSQLKEQAQDGHQKIDLDAFQQSMSWDLWSTWAWWSEVLSTHPLTAKRILNMGKIAEKQGQFPLIRFELEKPRSFVREFVRDLAARHLPWVISALLVAGTVAALVFGIRAGVDPLTLVGVGLLATGAALIVLGGGYLRYQRTCRRPKRFKKTQIRNLLTNPSVGPIRGVPVELEGVIIGRGKPGLWWDSDIKIDDGTARLLVEYHQLSRVVNFFVGLFKTGDWIDSRVVVRGWYRRFHVPWLELYQMDIQGRTKTMYNRALALVGWSIVLAVGIAVLLFGSLALGVLAMGVE